MKATIPLIIEIIALILITTGINYEIVIGGDFGWLSIAGGSILVAYGDMRHRMGKLEGKMELISKNMKVIMNNKKGEKP